MTRCHKSSPFLGYDLCISLCSLLVVGFFRSRRGLPDLGITAEALVGGSRVRKRKAAETNELCAVLFDQPTLDRGLRYYPYSPHMIVSKPAAALLPHPLCFFGVRDKRLWDSCRLNHMPVGADRSGWLSQDRL